MLELIVKNIDGKRVATVRKKDRGNYVVRSKDMSIEKSIEDVINGASDYGLPFRSDKSQRIPHGIRFQRLSSWLKPEDKDFLEALAERLVRYRLFAYTVETSSSKTISEPHK